jgi:hypothetical protein
VAGIHQEQVPLVTIVEAREGACQADDHLLDAATLAADQSGVDACPQRGS